MELPIEDHLLTCTTCLHSQQNIYSLLCCWETRSNIGHQRGLYTVSEFSGYSENWKLQLQLTGGNTYSALLLALRECLFEALHDCKAAKSEFCVCVAR
jgi:hypothetical protein